MNFQYTCHGKLEWFKNTTLETISLYHQYTLKLKELHIEPEIMKQLEAGHAEFQILIISLMRKNQEDTHKLSYLSDAADRLVRGCMLINKVSFFVQLSLIIHASFENHNRIR